MPGGTARTSSIREDFATFGRKMSTTSRRGGLHHPLWFANEGQGHDGSSGRRQDTLRRPGLFEVQARLGELMIVGSRTGSDSSPRGLMSAAGVEAGIKRDRNRPDVALAVLESLLPTPARRPLHAIKWWPHRLFLIGRETLAANREAITSRYRQFRQCQCLHRRAGPGQRAADADADCRSDWSCTPDDVLVLSTGVIGRPAADGQDRRRHRQAAAAGLSGGARSLRRPGAIRTTDTRDKKHAAIPFSCPAER